MQTGVRARGGIGERALRPDGVPKVRGEFAFGGDLWAERMLWGHALRSPHPAARICAIDIAPALAIAGVHAVLTADDVPVNWYGLDHRDQPVLVAPGDTVRHVGEPVVLVAADHPDTARRACAAVEVDYEVLAPLVDPTTSEAAAPLHPDGNVYRDLVIKRGNVDERGPVVVEGNYEIGMQDQAFMGPEAGLASPADDGGVDLVVSTQWLHNDRDQVAECLGLPAERVRLSLAGVGGAFGAREDVSLHVHACLLALHTQRPVKIVYSRAESFLGHVHRHPARIWMRHSATTDGALVSVEADILLDGGAYRSSSFHVTANAACFAAGPYRVPNARIRAIAVRTNNPPCGAMRGFGVVQSCFAHESQMDKLAEACGLDPVELRLRNALGPGDELLTGQRIDGTLPVADVIRACAALPVPAEAFDDGIGRPGGAGRTSDAADVARGVGFAVGFKNLMYSEGYMDGSVARCRIDHGVVTISCAAAEVGQGFVTLVQQIGRTVIGVDDVVVAPADTSIASAGSTSASRQTWMSGGAVEQACRSARAELERRAGGDTLDPATITELTRVEPVDVTEEFHHRLTHPLDADGQGDAHVSFACAAHRAVVDVDAELGLVRVVHLATAQDVGRVLNPLQVTGQIEGGIAQGLGLAVMEELLVDNGLVRNSSFTDYLIPTALDAPTVETALIEEPEPGAPFGAKGVGEPPTISSTPAIVAAIRAATGAACPRVPVRPRDIVGAPDTR
jgi:CO/xanthine dehydrogenase Mo-binding subunit